MKRYSDPYLAGIALGLVLLAAFVFAGRGLGASGAFATTAAFVAPDNAYLARYANGDRWLLYELAGVAVGGFVSALLAGRVRFAIERGPSVRRGSRLAFAFAGGAAMGIGAAIARGCTSGLALSGGALLAAGSWLFMFAAFAAGYAVAPLVRKAWR